MRKARWRRLIEKLQCKFVMLEKPVMVMKQRVPTSESLEESKVWFVLVV